MTQHRCVLPFTGERGIKELLLPILKQMVDCLDASQSTTLVFICRCQ